jgi:hypothetical protein
MTQALALQSLPEATLVAYLPPGTLIANANVNLNVASPLLQHSISPLDKETEVEQLATSQDPDIKCWFEDRKMRKAVQKIGTRVMKNSGKYDAVAALTAFQALVQADEKLHPEDRYGLIPPQGTYNSRIAVLLEEPSPVMAVETEPTLAGDHRVDKYASYLGKKGLAFDKCLVFYTYYRQRLARLPDEERKQREYTEHLRELTSHEVLCDFLLDSIPAHIVLLCGEFQVSRVLDKHGISLRLVPLRFGSRGLSAWLLVKGNQIHRMYIALPAFERVFHRHEFAAIQKYEHGINVAAALTNTENVRVRYFAGVHVLGIIIKYLREQRNGSSYNTLDDLHSDIQYWLLRNEHLTEVDGRWVLKDMSRFNKSGKNLVEYIHYLISSKGAMKVQQRALANARRGGEVTLYPDEYSSTSTRLRFGILNLPRINIPVPITKSWGMKGPCKANIHYEIAEIAHPNRFARAAKASDDGIRLGNRMEHDGRHVWLTRRGITAVKMANTIHDWLRDAPYEEILKRKDRYPLHSSKQLLRSSVSSHSVRSNQVGMAPSGI